MGLWPCGLVCGSSYTANVAFNDGLWHHLAVAIGPGSGSQYDVMVYKDSQLVNQGKLYHGRDSSLHGPAARLVHSRPGS